MKHYANLVPILLIFLYVSCSTNTTGNDINFTKLNDSIRVATLNNATWTAGPESISKHFFPSSSHPEENRNDSVEVKCSDETSCTVTVTDDGLFDDEVYG